MSIPWKEAGLRARDIALTLLIVCAVAALAVWNAFTAANVSKAKSLRLRISAVAARPLDAGTVLREDDVVIRIRRINPQSEFFDRTSQIVGRQLSRAVERNVVLQKEMLVESCLEEQVTFHIVVDGLSAFGLAPGDRVILTRAGKQDAITTMPIFTIDEVVDIQATSGEKKPVPDRRLALRAAYAADVMRVLASAGETSKLIPLKVQPPAKS
jgi:hypothetical protein